MAAGELRKAGTRVKLQDKPFQLLLLLLERPGEIVGREEVRQKLWPSDTFVDFDHSLGTAVAKLRTALGDSARTPRFVETVGGRGYRFLAPIAPGDEPPIAAAPLENDRPASTPRGPVRWVAASVSGGLAAGALVLLVVVGLNLAGVE